jgi:hypothetical protein
VPLPLFVPTPHRPTEGSKLMKYWASKNLT